MSIARASATGLTWVKSSYSDSEGAECVETAVAQHAVQVRDSKDTRRPCVTVSPQGWARFLDFAADGAGAATRT